METFLVLLFFWLILALVFASLGSWIGGIGGKGNEQTGFILGALLGPLGLIIAALIPASEEARERSSPVVTRDQSELARIAVLEAELALLREKYRQHSKAPSRPSKPLMPKRDKDDDKDGGIPTYRID